MAIVHCNITHHLLPNIPLRLGKALLQLFQ